jgi:hypothetical protein
MVPFEELQQLWQHQPSRRASVDPRETAALSHAFRRYGKRHDTLYAVKLIVIASLLALLPGRFWHQPLAAFAVCLAVFSGILFLIADWREQRAIARLNFAAPSLEFLRAAVARLQAQRNPFRRREFFIAMGGAWIGDNLIIVYMWSSMSVTTALAAHASVTAAQFGAFSAALWIRRRRFERECGPLIASLTALLQTLEGDSV